MTLNNAPDRELKSGARRSRLWRLFGGRRLSALSSLSSFSSFSRHDLSVINVNAKFCGDNFFFFSKFEMKSESEFRQLKGEYERIEL